jgi:dynactin complex subunit
MNDIQLAAQLNAECQRLMRSNAMLTEIIRKHELELARLKRAVTYVNSPHAALVECVKARDIHFNKRIELETQVAHLTVLLDAAREAQA